MNLKYFHFVFLVVSALVAFLFAGWEFSNYQATHQNGSLTGAIIAGVVGLVLFIYAFIFLRKARKLIL